MKNNKNNNIRFISWDFIFEEELIAEVKRKIDDIFNDKEFVVFLKRLEKM